MVVDVESEADEMRVTYLGEVGFLFGSLCDMSEDIQYIYVHFDRCVLVVAYIWDTGMRDVT